LVKPYIDSYDNGKIVREFSEDVESDELIWHRDKRTREITVLNGTGWKLQMDNQLPEELKKGKLYKIPKMEYHRLIKGTDKLVLKIWEETK
tara:strand:- start:522 stop:794 length:273 start_codon:yes stop_codon:yes gene_type:complete